MVVEAINKIGCAVEEFFSHVAHAVQVPRWFSPDREANKFIQVQTEEGVDELPHYNVPRCVVAFAHAVHSAHCAKTFFDNVHERAARHAALMSAPAAA